MTALPTLWYIAKESFGVAEHFWLISVTILTLAIAALAWGSPLKDKRRRRSLLFALMTYLVPVALMGVGALLRYDGPRFPEYTEPAAWRAVVLWLLFGANVLAVILIVVFSKGARIRAALLALPSVWFSAICGLIAAFVLAGVGP